MSAENVEIVRRMYAAFKAGDVATARAHFDPDVLVDVRDRADISPGRGTDFLLETIASWTTSFEDWREEIEEIHDADGRVYVVALQRGRGRDTGIDLSHRYGLVYDLERGKIVGVTMFSRPQDAAKEAGLSS